MCRRRERYPWCVPVSRYQFVNVSLPEEVSIVSAIVPILVCRYVDTGTGFHGDDDDVGA